MPWRSLSRITGAVLVVVATAVGIQGLLTVLLLLLLAEGADRAFSPPTDRRRPIRRRLGRGLLLALALAAAFLLIGSPALMRDDGAAEPVYDFTSGMEVTPPPIEDAADHRIQLWFLTQSAQIGFATLAIALLVLGIPHHSRRNRPSNRRASKSRVAPAPGA